MVRPSRLPTDFRHRDSPCGSFLLPKPTGFAVGQHPFADILHGPHA
jgi:hypothetical protein